MTHQGIDRLLEQLERFHLLLYFMPRVETYPDTHATAAHHHKVSGLGIGTSQLLDRGLGGNRN